jgi:hypothetical protein
MDQLRQIAVHDVLGMPAWVWALVLFLGGLNELIVRAKWTAAESILQGATRALLKVPALGFVLARFPLLGDALRTMAKLDKAEPVIPPPFPGSSARVLLPLLGLLALGGCAPQIVRARQAVSAASTLGTQAGELFVAVVESEQRGIARQLAQDHDLAKADRLRDEWRGKQATATKALKVYNTTVSGLGALAELSTAGGKFDIGQLLGGLARAYTQLRDVLDVFGVALPGGL